MHCLQKSTHVLSIVMLLLVAGCTSGQETTPRYKDATQSIDARVKDLLSRMTLEEKVGQMNMPCLYVRQLGADIPEKMENSRKFMTGSLVPGIGPGGGFFVLAHEILQEGPRQQAEFHNELQKIAVEQTRLGIPMMQIEEGTHGLMAAGATVFPEGLSLGSTWNMELMEQTYAVAAKEGRSIGAHLLCTLVIEPNRDPRLGRNQEAYTEDPYLSGRIARAIVVGAQGSDISAKDKLIAALCHYPGQSEPVGGLEKSAMDVSDRVLRRVFLPPWVEGITKAGALGVMATYPAIGDTPVHASPYILTQLLRDELKFQGLVLSEGNGFETLMWNRTAATQKEAGAAALAAGVDVGVTFEDAYLLPLIENVREGRVSMDLIDRAVRRILRIKVQLGLFENPYVEPDRAETVVNAAGHRELAHQAALESIVLLKNEGNLLPLNPGVASVVVIGPNADDPMNMLGDYRSDVILQDVVTVLEGIRARVPAATRVEYVKGCQVLGTTLNEIEKARMAARRASVAVVVLGENERWAKNPDGSAAGTNGEHMDSATLELTGLQEDLVRAVVSTGTPTVVVLINGRPLATRWIAEHVPAVVEAWLPGEQGGRAVTDVLFGDYNPSGRLPITVPRHAGQLPVYYNSTPVKTTVGRKHGGYFDMPLTPLYAFGHGLSYTSFEYSDLRITPSVISPKDSVQVICTVQNTGDRPGAEVVQLYVDDVLSSVVTPIMELRGFEKMTLAPGESREVTITLAPEDLALLDQHNQWIVEPGDFNIMVGRSSVDIRLRGKLEVQ